jgi:hypothetical protein
MADGEGNAKAEDGEDVKADCGDDVKAEDCDKAEGEDGCLMLECGRGVKLAGIGGATFAD